MKRGEIPLAIHCSSMLISSRLSGGSKLSLFKKYPDLEFIDL